MCAINIMSQCWPRRLACATRGGFALRSWPLLLPTFGLSSFFFTCVASLYLLLCDIPTTPTTPTPTTPTVRFLEAEPLYT